MENEAAYGQQQASPNVSATMARRVTAYFLDGVILAVMAFIVISLAWLVIRSRYLVDWVVWIGPFGSDGGMLLLMTADAVVLFCASLATALQVWLTNGYTVGKWLVHIRIQRTDGQKISLGTALGREVLVKGLLNGLSQGVLNIFSLLWVWMAPDHRTVQDYMAGTQVVLTLSLHEQ